MKRRSKAAGKAVIHRRLQLRSRSNAAIIILIEPDVRISRIRLSDWLHLEAHDGRLPWSWSLRSRTTPSSPKMFASKLS